MPGRSYLHKVAELVDYPETPPMVLIEGRALPPQQLVLQLSAVLDFADKCLSLVPNPQGPLSTAVA